MVKIGSSGRAPHKEVNVAAAEGRRTLSAQRGLEGHDVDTAKPAVVCGERTRTFGELRDASRRVAAGLVGLGIEELDRVAVLSRNRLELPEIEIGIAGAGAVMVALDCRLRRTELAEQLRRSGARTILVEDRFLDAVHELRASGTLSDLRTVVTLEAGPADLSYEELFASSRSERALEPRPDSRPRKILFRPCGGRRRRAVVWTEGAVLANARRQVGENRLRSEHSTLSVIDLCDVGGRHDLTWAALAQGATVHMARGRTMSSGAVFQYVAAHGITHLSWGPEPARGAAALPLTGEHDVARLDTIVCEWGLVPRVAVTRALSLFPHIEVVQVYGLKDGGLAVASLGSDDLTSKPGSVGRKAPGVEIRVVDPEGCPVEVDGSGEIHLRGPSLSHLSWEAGEVRDAGLGDGWLATGQHGRVDDDGFLFLAGCNGR